MALHVGLVRDEVSGGRREEGESFRGEELLRHSLEVVNRYETMERWFGWGKLGLGQRRLGSACRS